MSVLDNLFGVDDNAPLTPEEQAELQPPIQKEKKPCPECGKVLTWVADGSRPRAHMCIVKNNAPEPIVLSESGSSKIIRVESGQPYTLIPTSNEGPTVDEVVAKYVATRDLIAEKTKALENELAVLKDYQKKREAWLLGKLDASGVESMRTASGTCFVDWKDSVSVADPVAFMEWVHEDWETRRVFLTNAANKTAVKQRLSEDELPPPGVNYVKVKDVKIRRA